MNNKFVASIIIVLATTCFCFGQSNKPEQTYKLLATTKTSTMQKELNQSSAQGYRVLVGARTRGSEMVLFLSRDASAANPYRYKLLATSRTRTMQKELDEVSANGYRLIPSTMLAKKQLFGGEEIVMILERPPKVKKMYKYLLLATTRTSTLQKEVSEATSNGFVVVGMVSRDEHMVVMEREIEVNP